MVFGGDAFWRKRKTAGSGAPRKNGLAVSLDLNWDPEWNRASANKIRERKQAVRAILPRVDLAHGNVRELNEFADSSDLQTTLRRLAKWGVARGCSPSRQSWRGLFSQTENFASNRPRPPPDTSMPPAPATSSASASCSCITSPILPVRDKLRLANTIVSQFIAGKRPLIPTL